MRFVLLLLAAVAPAVAACSNNSSASTTTPSLVPTTEVLLGTVPTPVNGVLQSSINTFTVGQGGGSVTITLTSAVETLPGGSLLTTVTMGIALGTPSGSTCNTSAFTNATTTAQGGSTPNLSGSLAVGTYCVQVSDVTNQIGPVAYALAVTHP